jgi:hypothetical protein
VTSQGLDSLPVEVDAWSAELPVGVEAVDEAAEVTDQRFEAGTAFLDPFLQRLVPSRPHESATPSTRACSEAQKASGSVDGHLAPLATAWLTGGLPDDGCSAQRKPAWLAIRFFVGCALIIPMIIQTILLDPSGAVWSRLDRQAIHREQARSVWSHPGRRRASDS